LAKSVNNPPPYRAKVIEFSFGDHLNSNKTILGCPMALNIPGDRYFRGRRTGQVERCLEWKVNECLVVGIAIGARY